MSESKFSPRTELKSESDQERPVNESGTMPSPDDEQEEKHSILGQQDQVLELDKVLELKSKVKVMKFELDNIYKNSRTFLQSFHYDTFFAPITIIIFAFLIFLGQNLSIQFIRHS